MTNYPTSPATLCDEELAAWTANLSHAIAGRASDSHEFAWAADLLRVVSEHPSGAVRGELASRCSLGLLRVLAQDPDAYVRWCAAANPFCIDVDVQTTLASDPDERVVQRLLALHTVGLRAARAIISGPHTAAKAVLAHRATLRTELLEELAAQRDPAVRRPAARILAARYERQAHLADRQATTLALPEAA